MLISLYNFYQAYAYFFMRNPNYIKLSESQKKIGDHSREKIKINPYFVNFLNCFLKFVLQFSSTIKIFRYGRKT